MGRVVQPVTARVGQLHKCHDVGGDAYLVVLQWHAARPRRGVRVTSQLAEPVWGHRCRCEALLLLMGECSNHVEKLNARVPEKWSPCGMQDHPSWSSE